FHRSVRVRNAPAPPSYPTAQALVAEPADTPTSVLSTRDPLGLATMLHPSRGPAAAAAGDRPLSGAAAPPSTPPASPRVTPAPSRGKTSWPWPPWRNRAIPEPAATAGVDPGGGCLLHVSFSVPFRLPRAQATPADVVSGGGEKSRARG